MQGCVCACSVAQPCLTSCDPMHCSPPSSSVRGIHQAKKLEWVAISSSRESSLPRDPTGIFCDSCIGKRILYHEPFGKPSAGLPFWILILIVWYWGWSCWEEPELILRPHHRSYIKIYPASLTGCFLSLFSSSVLSYSLWLHRLQHARLPCISPPPWVCSNLCPSSQWCYLTISFLCLLMP